MPSSSSKAGLRGRAVISLWLNARVLKRRAAYRDSLASPAQKGAHMAFEVPPLPYDYGALEPHIDEQTMRVHHDEHHQAYVDNANAALADTDSAHESVEHVLSILDTFPEDKQTAIRNNAGGHVNHTLFWEI